MLRATLIVLLTFIIYSCGQRNKYPYSIKDFSKKLQPHLIKMVEEGIVMGHDNDLQQTASDADLKRLSKSEHPILRAAAFRHMQRRSFVDYFDLVMAHLDDTALVFTDAGEFGIWDRTVTDDILYLADWKTQELENKVVEEVIIKHNYLRYAYTTLQMLEPQKKFYSSIKDMATRPRRIEPGTNNELGFDDIEYALYGLAKFRKKEDVQVIKNRMMKHVWRLSTISFELMKKFPDTAYLPVLEAYHRQQFYEFTGNRPHGFSGFVEDRAAPEDFIEALVVQHNERSAMLLDTILTYLPKHKCMPDKETIIDAVIMAIWEHPCPAYAMLRKKVKPRAEEFLKKRGIPLEVEVVRHDK